jgi:TRAP-type C4-dicarboxylate transport system permease small subunit
MVRPVLPCYPALMTPIRIVGIILVLLGMAGLFTGGFSFTKETTKAQIGPLKLQVQEKESVNVPQWLSLGAIVIGGVLLAFGFSRK